MAGCPTRTPKKWHGRLHRLWCSGIVRTNINLSKGACAQHVSESKKNASTSFLVAGVFASKSKKAAAVYEKDSS